MTIIRCPRCRDEVTMPPRANSRALVRCPLCLEQYLLSEAIANAPPALVIIGGEVEQAAIESPTGDDEYRLAGGRAEAAVYQPTPAAAVATAAPRPALRSAASRPRQRQGSPLLLLINYVGGGVMGLALGLLVLWWGFKKDPLALGPTFAAYTPWLVPVEFRGKPGPVPQAETPPPTPARSATTKSARKAAEPRDEPLQSLPVFENTDLPSAAALTPAIETPLLTDPTAVLPPNGNPKPDVVGPASATAVEASALAGDSMPDLTGLLPNDWPIFVPQPDNQRAFLAATDLTDAIAQATRTLAQYRDTSAVSTDDRREALVQLHADLGEIGRLLSYREPGQTGLAEPMNEVEKLLVQLATDQSATSPLAALTAENWPDLPDGRGLLAIGIVTATQSAGDLYLVSLRLNKDSAQLTLPVAMAANPEDLCQPGDQLLVVGRVVEEPKINLPGYEGEHPRLLMSGFVFRGPKPE